MTQYKSIFHWGHSGGSRRYPLNFRGAFFLTIAHNARFSSYFFRARRRIARRSQTLAELSFVYIMLSLGFSAAARHSQIVMFCSSLMYIAFGYMIWTVLENAADTHEGSGFRLLAAPARWRRNGVEFLRGLGALAGLDGLCRCLDEYRFNGGDDLQRRTYSFPCYGNCAYAASNDFSAVERRVHRSEYHFAGCRNSPSDDPAHEKTISLGRSLCISATVYCGL